ncbi:MAG: hypothetical protein SGI73_03010 [Chloroflexota bacterium]|nr:hypothetical protein [Chloroflexota bacterium]
MVVADDPTLPPRYIVETYRKAYESLYSCVPKIRYLGNHWYTVNDETVHRVTLMEEIARLRTANQKQDLMKTDKGIIKKLINKLRGL